MTTKTSSNSANITRDMAGVTSILNAETGAHKGTVKRPTEAKRLDEITAEDIGQSGKVESPMANPTFGQGGKEKA